MKTVYIDTGPIVAILDKRDEHHIWASERISEIDTSLKTTSIIITEAFYILKNIYGGIERLFQTLEEGHIQLTESYPTNMNIIHRTVLKYRDIDASLGDASLLSLSEENNDSVIFTLDYDFHIYRDSKGNPLNLISPYKK